MVEIADFLQSSQSPTKPMVKPNLNHNIPPYSLPISPSKTAVQSTLSPKKPTSSINHSILSNGESTSSESDCSDSDIPCSQKHLPTNPAAYWNKPSENDLPPSYNFMDDLKKKTKPAKKRRKKENIPPNLKQPKYFFSNCNVVFKK